MKNTNHKCLILFWFTQLLFGSLQAQISPSPEIHYFLLRGLSRESGHWEADFLSGLKNGEEGVFIHYMDLPGAGMYNQMKAPTSVPKMAVFLHQENAPVLHSVDGQKVLIVTSLAGNIGMEWIRQHPYEFDKLVLVGPSFKKICKSKERVKKAAKKGFVQIMLTADREKREHRILNINSKYHQQDTALFNTWMQIQEIHPISRKNIFRQSMAGMFYKAVPEPVGMETLIVGTFGDQIIDPECTCKIRDTFGGDLIWHPNAGHGISIDAGKWLGEQIRNWVAPSRLPDPLQTVGLEH